jgi:Transposase DDE domain
MKSFRPKDGSGAPPAPDFHGERRRNETQASITDPDARLYRKGSGQPAKLAYLGHVMMENRHALVIDSRLNLATGTAEREAALEMVADRPGNHRITLGADKAYDVAGFVADLREYNVTPHVAQNTTNRRSAIDGRTTRHPGYAVSGRVRKRIEEVFGWTKAAAGFRKTHHLGLARVGWMFTLTATAYNLIRLNRLLREHADGVGLDPSFTVLDRSDSEDRLNLVRNDLGLAKNEARFGSLPSSRQRFSCLELPPALTGEPLL